MPALTIQRAYELAVQNHQAGRLPEAESLYRQILSYQPEHADALEMLGVLAHQAGRSSEAVELIRRAIALNPHVADYYSNLGGILTIQGRLDDAIAAYRQALVLRPDLAEAHNNLGVALKRAGQLDEAIASYRRAIALQPGDVRALNNLAGTLKAAAQLDEAVAVYRKAEAVSGDARIGSNLLYALQFHPDYDPARLYEEHVRWNQRYARPLLPTKIAHDNDRSTSRRLRLGYVSGDFYQHPVGRWLCPLLSNHDHAAFEIFCYSNVISSDAMTNHLRRHADIWRQTVGLSDAQLAELILRDHIDILVDLTMHMEGSRLLAFARRPAPVQVTYLAYPGTTGLETIDYRLTDPHLDPPVCDESCYSERLVRLPRTWCCYLPSDDSPQVGTPPALSAGRITFASLNNFCKITQAALSVWGRLLSVVPDSVLILHSPEGSHRDRAKQQLAADGVDPARVRFADRLPLKQYLELHQQVDIGLDPFPYAGGTTTCDALWMGVPVVTLAGQTAASRGGLTLLANLGLEELVARDPEQYVQIAANLARDLPRLTNLRTSLRPRMTASPLMDAPRFACDVEAAFRQMWVSWCDARHAR